MARDSCFGSVELPNLTTTSTCLVFSSSNTHCSGIRSTKERSIVSVSKKNATNNKTIPKEEQLLPETTGLLTGKTITERRIREKGLIQGQTWLDACAQQMKQNCDKISGVEDGILDLMKQTINQMKNMEAMQKELENAKMRENHLETMVAKLSLKIYDAQKEHFEAKLKEALRKSRHSNQRIYDARKEHFEAKLKEALRKSRHSRNQDLRLPSIGDRYSKSSGREGVGKARVLRNSALKRKAVGKVTMQAPKRRRNRLVKTCRACRKGKSNVIEETLAAIASSVVIRTSTSTNQPAERAPEQSPYRLRNRIQDQRWFWRFPSFQDNGKMLQRMQ
eukprot:CAMPEP_0170199032 /NCGR_PEP_ID=MMETSP0040_2-20121228/69115_1 /TAXON_ID=641309 /ORGANISM="Lotharella oceanica, Strain CCMP622" /LENGTH=333 /DNA_ID=CAMNT_0010449111 /DNA_START=352 /DNA_END=1354 /DNA_ORIENTATION=+